MEKMKRNVSEKMMLQKQMKNKKGDDKKNRFLVSINFVGSAGPIRFVVNGDDLVSGVIDTALKTYARGGRLPVLGFDVNKFLLYCANPASDALNPWEPIGSQKGRNFMLCKKQLPPQKTETSSEIITAKKPTFSLMTSISTHMRNGWCLKISAAKYQKKACL